MRTAQERLSLARAVGNNGCDYCGAETLAYTESAAASPDSEGWYGFVVNEAATVTAVVMKDSDGNTLTVTPTWLEHSLSSGVFIPAGFVSGEDAYISSITLSGGSIILYAD